MILSISFFFLLFSAIYFLLLIHLCIPGTNHNGLCYVYFRNILMDLVACILFRPY